MTTACYGEFWRSVSFEDTIKSTVAGVYIRLVW